MSFSLFTYFEIDFCRDESDESEEEYIAQRFDFEYEVEDLSDSADLESCGSSSGVDVSLINSIHFRNKSPQY